MPPQYAVDIKQMRIRPPARTRDAPRRTTVFALAAAACTLAGAVAGPSVRPATAEAAPNPANHPKLLDRPIEPYRYDYAKRCRHKLTRGLVRLRSWVDRHYRGVYWGGMRCERLPSGRFSLHSEGRALDWGLDVRNRWERRAAWHLIRRLLATDRRGNPHALARRMGVQEIIFACRSWYSGAPGLSRYGQCRKGVDRTTAHRDHIHLGLNWRGATARSSFWRSPLWKH